MALRHGLGITGNNQGVVTSMDHKLDQLGMVAKTGVGNAVRQGIFYAGLSNIVSGTAGTSTNDRGYSVAPFTAAISRGAGAGVIFITNDGTATPAANPALRTTAADSSNPRIDAIYVWQREYILDGQDSEPVFGVVQGTPAAIPQAPLDTALPAGALRLADFTVPAGATNTNAGVGTQRAPFTAMHGGDIHVRTEAEMNAIQGAKEGDRAKLISGIDVIEYWRHNNKWLRWDTGWVAVTLNSGWVQVANSVPAPSIRRIGTEVLSRGRISRATTAATSPFNYPDDFRVGADLRPLFANSSAGIQTIVALPDGTTAAWPTVSVTDIGLAGLRFHTD